MFCPKCGTRNPDTGRFCRSCGADLSGVSAALTSGSSQLPQVKIDVKGKPVNLESAVTKIFTGLAFLIIALILGYTGMIGGRVWWFWLLIPAFGSLGSGVAQYLQIKKYEQRSAGFAPLDAQSALGGHGAAGVLPPSQTDYIRLREMVATGNKIEAIKFYREATGADLKTAKDAVELIELEQAAGPANKFGGDYVSPPKHSIYDTGDLPAAPPSVTEDTTRHLSTDSEGETMTLPKK